ncbi:DUF4129 domain-containing protein [Metabacillus litoralis]|uniref:DUF4129 domain-containing protein n=1 Tax=Metabacillus litoralis TaxID=152268 RepID=A0A5C6VZ82_9BACI|nr:DUF4129 domain-containing protein [Metabacillus litoralis]TXC90304.1 DUF4129 domain-containing protein [Metabacillus litoralis]
MLNDEKAKKELQEILNQREYLVYEEKPPGFIEKWWNSVEDWLSEWLEGLFPTIEPASGIGGQVLLTLIVIMILLLLGVFVFIIFRNGKRKRALRKYQPLQTIDEMKWSYQKHLRESERQELQREFNLSTRHLFLGLLLYFHEKDLLKARIWKTNWEYYDELMKVNKQWANQFYNLAQLFDEVTYGERIIGEEEYHHFKKIVLNLIEDEEFHHHLSEQGERNGV